MPAGVHITLLVAVCQLVSLSSCWLRYAGWCPYHLAGCSMPASVPITLLVAVCQLVSLSPCWLRYAGWCPYHIAGCGMPASVLIALLHSIELCEISAPYCVLPAFNASLHDVCLLYCCSFVALGCLAEFCIVCSSLFYDLSYFSNLARYSGMTCLVLVIWPGILG